MTSTYDSRDVVLKCLSLGASDYWLKPLRANEVRNLWTRVWWRKVRGIPWALCASRPPAAAGRGTAAAAQLPQLSRGGPPVGVAARRRGVRTPWGL